MAVALAALALVVPGPWQRLANVDGDTRAPLYDRPLDDASLRRTRDVVPDGATYYVDVVVADPLLRGNVKAATQLYLAPALPVVDSHDADYYVLLGRGGRVHAVPSP